MGPKREVTACDRCRQLKRRCDRARPACTRCQQTGFPCSLDHAATSPTRTATNHSLSSDSASESTVWEPPTEASRPTQIPTSDLVNDSQPSVADVTSAGGEKSVRRRNRTCLSCSRCHRMKVKCDKKLPCTRCQTSGFADACVYKRPLVHSVASSHLTEAYLIQEDPEASVIAFHSRHRGSSNWKTLLQRIQPLYRFHSPSFALAIRELSQRSCGSGLILPGNYPFGSLEAAKYASTEAVMRLLKNSASSLPTYVDSYLRIFDPIHPILDAHPFHCETLRFDGFSGSPSVDEMAWLAQYLMVLGLGCSAKTGDEAAGVEFFLAAETCLMRTPFMFKPCLSTLKTLCLMVFAKQVVNATCWAIDSCWSLAGIAIRLAVMLGLHQDPAPAEDDVVLSAAWEARRMLWTTILHLNIETAIITGMPSLLCRDEILFDGADTSAPSPGPGASTTQPCKQQLYNTFPTILEVLARVNSNANRLTYEEVVQYDLTVRGMMAGVIAPAAGLRRTGLDIFFRRVILILHREFAHRPDAPSQFPVSYWSSLESSLGLLVHHRELCDGRNRGLTLAATVFGFDFFSAALSACIHLLHENAPLVVPATALAPGKGGIPPRQTILETLKSCVEIWACGQDRSICFRTGYRFLTAAVELITETPSL